MWTHCSVLPQMRCYDFGKQVVKLWAVHGPKLISRISVRDPREVRTSFESVMGPRGARPGLDNSIDLQQLVTTHSWEEFLRFASCCLLF